MPDQPPLTRRSFLRTVTLATACLALPSSLASPVEAGPAGVLEEFGYGDVTLAPGRAQEQFEETLAVLMHLSEDSMLKPYRDRAGQPAPGEDLGGWYDNVPGSDYGKDTNIDHGFAAGHCFGQWVSSLARAYSITGASAVRDKMLRLIRAYVPTIRPQVYADFRWPTYTYDKLACGLIDAFRFARVPEALTILEKTLDTALSFFPPRALDHDEMRARRHQDESYCWDESYTISENLFLAYDRGASARYRDLGVRFLKCCHHAARVQEVVGKKVADVRRGHGQADLRRGRLGGEAQGRSREHDVDQADGDSAAGNLYELEQAPPEVRRTQDSSDRNAGEDAKENDSGGVVAQALTLHQGGQAARCPKLAKQRYHRDGVGGRDQRAKHERVAQGEAQEDVEADPHQRARNQQAHGGQGRDGYLVPPQGTEVQVVGRIEDQRGQQNEQDELGVTVGQPGRQARAIGLQQPASDDADEDEGLEESTSTARSGAPWTTLCRMV